MSSTFFGLNIGASALNAFSACTNTTANNVANADTPGYSKQVTNLYANGALRNNMYGTLGSGVVAESITQLRNTYYDVKYWTNNSFAGQYEKKIYYMEQIQNLFKDEGVTKGFTSIYKEMFNSLESLKGDGGDEQKRNQFINSTEAFMEYFNNMSQNLKDIQSDCNQEIRALVSQINSYAEKISVINAKINTLEVQGTYANELRDQRALLIDGLSQLVPVEVEEIDIKNSNYPEMDTGATHYRIKVGGQLLVDGDAYQELKCVSREEKINQNDIDGLYDIVWADTGNEFNAASDSMSGQLKAVMDIRDGNNNENFQGVLSNVSGNVITIKDPNLTTVEAMNMPPEGRITIGNRDYTYSEFKMYVQVDNNGNKTYSYEFTLSDRDLTTLAGKTGERVSIGRGIDSRGIPYYQTQMNEFLRSICRKMNDIQKKGVDLEGNPMDAFIVAQYANGTVNDFSDAKNDDEAAGKVTEYSSDLKAENYYFLTAENVTVNSKSLKDPNHISVSASSDIDESKAELVDEMLKLQDDTVVYRGSGGTQFLEYITSDISVDAQEADILYSNYLDVSNTIDSYRMSVSSVDEDEEGMDLIKFQNAYDLASKIISVMNQMYDRLITQTGV